MAETGITDFLDAWNRGEDEAIQGLFPHVTDELLRIARAYMREERADHTLQPTALINECYLRLADRHSVSWRDRSHFFAFAARCMRRILVDHARARLTAKRGQGQKPITIEAELAKTEPRQLDVIAVNEALERLAGRDEHLAKLVELRIFGGLEMREIAGILEVSRTTAGRDWSRARAWLARELRG